MNINTVQTICQILVVAGMFATALGGFGAYLAGKKIDKQKDKNIDTLMTGNLELKENNKVLLNDLSKIKKINEELEKRIPALSGVLIPNNKPTPPNTCGTIPPHTLALFFGNSVAYTNSFPHTVIEVGDKQLLVINKESEKITVSAKFFNRDGKIVAELKDNKFDINPNNYFRIERPNDHILIVYDQQATQILNVEYLNPSVIKLLGIFYLPNRSPIIINEDWQTYGGIKMSGNCFGNNRVDIHLD